MTIRYYLLPIIGTGIGRGDPRRPKYVGDLGIRPWSMMDYGLLPAAILMADVTPQQHTDLTANSDVRAIPANLDSTVGAGAVTATRNALEALSIPGNWVVASDTWRVVLRTTAGLFQFAQRVHGRFNVTLLESGVTLNTTWTQLSQGAKDILLATAQELGIDTSQATGSTTLRQIFKAFGDAWGNKTLIMGGIEI